MASSAAASGHSIMVHLVEERSKKHLILDKASAQWRLGWAQANDKKIDQSLNKVVSVCDDFEQMRPNRPQVKLLEAASAWLVRALGENESSKIIGNCEYSARKAVECFNLWFIQGGVSLPSYRHEIVAEVIKLARGADEQKTQPNPVSKLLIITSVATLISTGLAASFDSPRWLMAFLIWGWVASFGIFIIWTLFSLRAGVTHGMETHGRLYKCYRSKEPKLFIFLISFYLILGCVGFVSILFTILS